MASMRKPFQGVGNILRFNRHFYLTACMIFLFLLLIKWYILLLVLLAIVSVSILASFYIYDRSDLYELKWAGVSINDPAIMIVNIHAGFDETSLLLREKFPRSSLKVFDFYDPGRHTEISIKRARRAYPPYPGTQGIHSSCIPLDDQEADKIFLTLSAHEIRDEEERTALFSELKRVLRHDGCVFVTEHVRDLPNFLVYNIGYFHFISRRSWYRTFKEAGFKVVKEEKTTPFITTFILNKHGI
ncbi:MAG TPA: class I SAM-dependent methyltransferase [Puia sp.]|nr:class I SAM-dependent methyltransferase [Puia sp.]